MNGWHAVALACGIAFAPITTQAQVLVEDLGDYGVEVEAAPREDSDVSDLLRGNLTIRQLRPLEADGKPFFPIGAYGIPVRATFQDVRDAGWNLIRYHVHARDPEFPAIEVYEEALREAGEVGLKLMIMSHRGVLYEQPRGEFMKRVDRFKKYDAFIGMYLADEPDNDFWGSRYRYRFDDFLAERGLAVENRRIPEIEEPMNALSYVVHDQLAWLTPAFHAVAQRRDLYTFMAIGWHNKYLELAPLTDVLMANTYPVSMSEEEFGNNQARVVMDARLAAQAADAAGGMGFIYTPYAVSPDRKMRHQKRASTQAEFRYNVYGPITQGAMGIISWAAYRCSHDYAKEVYFPVTRKLSELEPFLVGKWLDEQVRWLPQDRGTAELKSLDLPRVSTCLRQSSDGRYLLIAVNNSPEPTEAEFYLDLPDLEDEVVDHITGNALAFDEDGRLKTAFGPHGVVALILTPKAGE